MLRPSLSASLLVVLLAAPAGAAAISYASAPDLRHEVHPDASPATFTFTVPLRLDEPRSAYLKVVPVPGNPVFQNGTAETGWWTTVSLDAAGTSPQGTNGTGVVELGTLPAGSDLMLRLDVRTPQDALSVPRTWELHFAVAVRSPSGAGSGGQLDQSLSLRPAIVVSPASEGAPAAAGPDVVGWAAPLAAVGLLGFVWWRRRSA